MGLAFEALSSTNSPPFWQSLVANGQLASPEMSFWINRLIDDTSAPEEAFGGIFTLGGSNSTLYEGEIEFLDLPTGTPTFWLLQMSRKSRVFRMAGLLLGHDSPNNNTC